MKEKDNYIYGKNPVFEALNSPEKIEKIYIPFGISGGHIDKLTFLARKAGIAVSQLDKKKFNDLERKVCPRNVNSQGMIALVSMVEPIELQQLIESLDLSDNPLLVALDGITDPHNLGAIARSAECAGAKALILPEHDSAPVTAVAYKASAGALEYLKVSKVGNLNQALEELKEAGFWITGTAADAETPYYANIYDRPNVVVIGSEGKGIRPSTLKHCDDVVSIPMAGNTESLNASVSAGIVLIEVLRQRIARL